jgi:hypothetical protein
MIAGLGAFALHLMVRLDNPGGQPDSIATLAPLLARYALWFFAVPILWTVAATALQGRLPAKAINTIGIVVTIALFLVIAAPLAFYLW